MIEETAPALSKGTPMPIRFLLFGLLLTCSMNVLPGHAETPDPDRPRMISLSEDGLPLSKALAELETQMGLKKGVLVDRRNAGDPALKVKLQNVPFWKAIDLIADEVGASVYLSPRDGKISLVKRQSPTPAPINYSGPFRLVVKRISVARDLETNTYQATAALEVAWEPQLQLFLLETRPQHLVVKDDRNATLPFDGEGSSIATVDGRIALLFDVALPAPQRNVNALGLVEGNLSAVGPGKMLQFRFGNLGQLNQAAAGAAIRQQQQEGITCRITKGTLEKERWTIQVTHETPPGGNKLESFQSWAVNNEMTLESKDGARRLTSSSYSGPTSAPGGLVVFNYNFTDKDGVLRGKAADWNLLYTTPASVVVRPIPFQFKNVPLP
jgi:hypothetical protein